ncbi:MULTISPECIES: helix-turn-helix domain-containing protein [Halobacterium]|uniref:winged helix-turn-helix domain-containing protein n=1 Tax=Halobacterium TaxID=2239 RepID=UPI00073F9F8D|nr:helix-turn-helix domain-containing protein [Halobacterium sp. CBA1132]MCG1002974.1 helix-turn-helix domain-containing protein [Halobacterium noricense]
MDKDCSSLELFDLLSDEYARAILKATSTQTMSAKTLSETCDASLPTVYRRVERLIAVGLLEEMTEVAEDGHHFSVYEARLDHLVVDLDDGVLDVDVTQTDENFADQFTDLWESV